MSTNPLPQSPEAALIESTQLLQDAHSIGIEDVVSLDSYTNTAGRSYVSGEAVTDTDNISGRLAVYSAGGVMRAEVTAPQGVYTAHSDIPSGANIIRVDRGEYQHKFADPDKRRRAAVLIQRLASKPVREAIDASADK